MNILNGVLRINKNNMVLLILLGIVLWAIIDIRTNY